MALFYSQTRRHMIMHVNCSTEPHTSTDILKDLPCKRDIKKEINQLSATAYQFSAENAINSAQDFYRVQKPCSSIERTCFGQLPVEVSL